MKAAGSGALPAPVPSDQHPVGAVDHEVIYRFMDVHRAKHRIATMARILGVSRSGYYAWKTRPPSFHDRTDEVLKKEISGVYACHQGTYGAPRIHRVLQRQGWKVSRKRVARLMRELGIDGLPGARRGRRSARLGRPGKALGETDAAAGAPETR